MQLGRIDALCLCASRCLCSWRDGFPSSRQGVIESSAISTRWLRLGVFRVLLQVALRRLELGEEKRAASRRRCVWRQRLLLWFCSLGKMGTLCMCQCSVPSKQASHVDHTYTRARHVLVWRSVHGMRWKRAPSASHIVRMRHFHLPGRHCQNPFRRAGSFVGQLLSLTSRVAPSIILATGHAAFRSLAEYETRDGMHALHSQQCLRATPL